MDIGGEFRLLVNNVDVTGTDNGSVSIDLLRPGKPPERIGAFNARRGRLNNSEYQALFHARE